MNVFQFDCYKIFIKAKLKQNSSERGYQKRLAEAACCHGSFLSQVLNAHVHLTPDHAACLCEFWGMDSEETEYFISLVYLARAASKQYRAYLKSRLEELKAEKSIVTRERKKGTTLRPEDQARYYSAWYWAAIHILVSIAEFRTPNAIARRLRIPESLVSQCLTELSEMNLIEEKAGRWKPTKIDIHLPNRSDLNWSNHAQWRQLANLRMQESTRSDELHYSAVFSASTAAIAEIRAEVLDVISRSREIIAPSSDEDMACMLVDFFQV